MKTRDTPMLQVTIKSLTAEKAVVCQIKRLFTQKQIKQVFIKKTTKKVYSVLRSPHVNKNAQEQFYLQQYSLTTRMAFPTKNKFWSFYPSLTALLKQQIALFSTIEITRSILFQTTKFNGV